MSKYTITIEGDFKRGECKKCEFHYLIGQSCILDTEECPLEEVKQGEWMVINAEGDSIEVVTTQCNDMRGGKE